MNHRAVFRLWTLLILVIGAVAAGTSSSRAQESPLPAAFNVEITSSPVRENVGVSAVFPLHAPVAVAHTSVSLSTQPLVVAQAAPLFQPLAQTLAAGQPLPAAPWCFAYFPGEPAEATCGGAGPDGPARLDATSGRAVASGDFDDPRALAARAAARGAGFAADGLPVDIAEVASTSVTQSVDGAVVGAASTAVDDLVVADVLRIEAVRSTVSGSVRGVAGATTFRRELVISKATVAGQPVTIDADGVHVADSDVLGPAPDQEQVDGALDALGVSVRVEQGAEPDVAADGSSLKIDSARIVIAFNDGAGTVGELVLGESQLFIAATTAATFSSASPAVSPFGSPADPPASRAPAASFTPVPPVSGTDTTIQSSLGEAPAAPRAGDGAPPPTATNPPARFAGLPAGGVGDIDWNWLFPPFIVLGALIPGLVVARRLPLSRS